ncbi:MAG: DUF4338 domain-containing protein [Bacteroidetes bacterium]|nr:DUF4338 domain-containing protein [Bacteroidota bacterium]MDE2673328.1 DUF4338 domain-containing protein [Bacteroidota bacterium]
MLEADALRQVLEDHLIELGFSKNGSGYRPPKNPSKQAIRDLHSEHRKEVLEKHGKFINAEGLLLSEQLADGKDLDPTKIKPEIIEVSPGSVEARLFRFATLLWSIPVSQGFGRRLRFLVRDQYNGRLIGLFALGDPVFNLNARDLWIGWSHKDRAVRLVHVMDAYVLGAVPPYSYLIGGKLIAALLGSQEVQDAYERKYLGVRGIISQRENHAHLVLVTTTSALGRSSLYNRLKIPGGIRFIRIGETKGYGHFHISSEIFDALRAYLESEGHPYANGNKFGMGPNWKIRVIRTALTKLGIDGDSILKHGIRREVYAVPLADNFRSVLLGQKGTFESKVLPASEISDYCLKRWVLPRAGRDHIYKNFRRPSVLETLQNGRLMTGIDGAET